MGIFDLIPDHLFRYIGITVVVILSLGLKFGLFKFVKVKVELPEHFMRHFRWITPLLLIINCLGTYIVYRQVQEIRMLCIKVP